MKKENREQAKQKRAEERRKEAEKKKIMGYLSWIVPLAVVVILVLVIIVDAVHRSNAEKEETTQETTTAAVTVLNSDSSLTVENGDTVNIDYVGTIDGTAFDGGSTDGTGTDLVIGSGNYIDDFEDQLIGHHPGETVDVNVTFPDNYGNDALNGKDALFTVTINGIYTSASEAETVFSEKETAESTPAETAGTGSETAEETAADSAEMTSEEAQTSQTAEE